MTAEANASKTIRRPGLSLTLVVLGGAALAGIGAVSQGQEGASDLNPITVAEVRDTAASLVAQGVQPASYLVQFDEQFAGKEGKSFMQAMLEVRAVRRAAEAAQAETEAARTEVETEQVDG